MDYRIEKTDVLVIGRGIAGLRAADEAARAGLKVTLAAKGGGASPGVMGFNATTSEADSVDLFHKDILDNGYGINNYKVSRRLAADSNHEVKFMESIGLAFDKNPDGKYNLFQTLGCSTPRMVHIKSLTGQVGIDLLTRDCRKQGVNFVEPVRILNLLKNDQGAVAGASAFDLAKDELVFFLAKAVVLASGGNGAMFTLTSYPGGINGDGYAMAYRAGAELVDMEFQQFDPCGFVHPPALRGHVVVTTMLNEGGRLYNKNNEEFMLKDGGKYNVPKAELSRRIWREVAEGRGFEHGGVMYDVSALSYERLVVDHCLFYDPAKAAGVDLCHEPAEVVPVPHSCMGGLVIDENCASTLPGLYVAGEATGGIHGANRIGGNAGTEIFVYGWIAGDNAAKYAKAQGEPRAEAAIQAEAADFAAKRARGGQEDPAALLTRAKLAADKGLNIVRCEKDMDACLSEITALEAKLPDLKISDSASLMTAYTLENNLALSKLQATVSKLRKESRGVFYRSDFPEMNDAEGLKNIFVKKAADGTMAITEKPVAK